MLLIHVADGSHDFQNDILQFIEGLLWDATTIMADTDGLPDLQQLSRQIPRIKGVDGGLENGDYFRGMRSESFGALNEKEELTS